MTKLEQYLLEHIKERSHSIAELETYAQHEHIPIMDPVSINFLMQLIRIHKPKHILEIGTAIGYSALRMHEAYPETKITTIERNDHFYQQALSNIKQFKKENHIKIVHGDALTVINDYITKQDQLLFDFVFIDAAKAQYKRFFTLAEQLLTKNGVIVSDNVLFKGLVVDNKGAQKRLNKLANKVRKYNKWLSERDDFATSIVPIGDGVAISTRI